MQGIGLGTTIENDSKLTSEVDGFLKEGKSSDNESISRLDGHMGSQDEDLMHISILSRTSREMQKMEVKKLGVTNCYGTYKIGDKYKFLLEPIFGFALPRKWKESLIFLDNMI